VVIVGTRDSAHVDNALAAADLHLDEDVLTYIESLMPTRCRSVDPLPKPSEKTEGTK
jgi:aryl-alcohol dehydrogenase-like predicted oxidoreductase